MPFGIDQRHAFVPGQLLGAILAAQPCTPMQVTLFSGLRRNFAATHNLSVSNIRPVSDFIRSAPPLQTVNYPRVPQRTPIRLGAAASGPIGGPLGRATGGEDGSAASSSEAVKASFENWPALRKVQR